MASTLRCGLGNGVLVLAPEVLLALAESDDPRRQEATGDSPCPVVLLGLVLGDETATGCLLDDPDHSVDQDVAAHTGNKTIGDRVSEWHEGNGEESRDGVTHVPPVDLGDSLHHHGTDQDEHTASSPGRDRSEDWSKEDGNEEANTGDTGSETSLATFRDASTRLDKRSDWRGSKKSTDGDANGVNHVSNRGALEVLGDRVNQVGELSHGVQGTSTIENIDVEEGDQGKTELSSVAADAPLLHAESLADLMKVHNLPEEVKGIVTDIRIGEVGERGSTRPGDDADQDDSGNDGTLDTVHHEDDGEDTSAEDTNPHGRVAHLGVARAETVHLLTLDTSSELKRGRSCTDDQSQTFAVSQTDQGKEQADTNTGGELDGTRDGTSEPLAHTEQSQGEEDPSFNEDSGKSNRVWHRASTVETDDCVCEVGIKTHTGCQRNRPVPISLKFHLAPAV